MEVGKDTGLIFDYSKYLKEIRQEERFKKGGEVKVIDEVLGLEVTKTIIDIKDSFIEVN